MPTCMVPGTSKELQKRPLNEDQRPVQHSREQSGRGEKQARSCLYLTAVLLKLMTRLKKRKKEREGGSRREGREEHQCRVSHPLGTADTLGWTTVHCGLPSTLLGVKAALLASSQRRGDASNISPVTRIKNVSKHCQVSSGGQSLLPPLRITELMLVYVILSLSSTTETFPQLAR